MFSELNMSLTKRRAVSPILATVLLIAVTIVASALVYSTFTQAASTATESNGITVLDANLIATSDHGSFSMTIKNSGTKPWKAVSINGYKGDTPALIFYRPISWNAAGGNWGPSDPVSPSNVIDLDPSSTNSLKVIGIGNLISYRTENPVFWGFSGLKLWPTKAEFCAQSYSKIRFVDAQGNCNDGLQSYIGKKLDKPISPGETLAPAAFVLTKQLTNSTGGQALPHDFVANGQVVVISIIAEAIDGTKTQKDVEIRVT